MPSIELSKLQAVSAPRALSESDRTVPESRAPSRDLSAVGNGRGAGVSIEVEPSSDTLTPPVDQDRVAQIRDALRDGSYPLVPTEIVDAMIAARLSMGIER